jgi:hypothetical protein
VFADIVTEQYTNQRISQFVISPCLALRKLVTHGTNVGFRYYHRYLHGQVVLTRYLLPSFGVAGLRKLYKNTISALLLAGLAIASVQLIRTRRMVFGGFAIAFSGFARWYGLGFFGQSLGHGPSDIVIVLYLGFLCVIAGRGCSVNILSIAGGFFGSATMIFELLTGGLPLGLALVFGVSPMAAGIKPPREIALAASIASGVSFVVAAVVCALLKLVATEWVFGSSAVFDYGHQLTVRMGLASGEHAPSGGVDLFITKIIGGMSSLSEYTGLLAGGTILLAVCVGVWGLIAIHRSALSGTEKVRAALLGLSNVVFPIWFVVFWQHTIQHAWFMDRILCWPIVSGFWLFLLGFSAPSSNRDILSNSIDSPPAVT